MREILFRGKNKEKNSWAYGNLYIKINGDAEILRYCNEGKFEYHSCGVVRNTVGQYTGLIDKNGEKIFEHDIISAHLDDLFPENETRLIVVWHDCGFFGINPRYLDYTQYNIDLITMITSQQSELKDVLFDSLENQFVKKFEVIGNIYDNTDLLK